MIEALVTITVLGLLTATVGPTMGEWVRTTHVRNLAQTTQAGLQKARSEAMKRNRVVALWLVSPTNTTAPDNTCATSASSGAWVISVDDPSGKCATAPSLTDAPRIIEVYGPGKGAEGLTVAAVDAANNAASSVSFNGYGQRVGGGIAAIDIKHTSDTSVRPLRIQISTSGGVRMCDPAVASPDARACNP
jgi:type IV fimbrial biogenesis protein FimT